MPYSLGSLFSWVKASEENKCKGFRLYDNENTKGIFKSIHWVVTNTNIPFPMVKTNLQTDQNDEAKDAFAANNFKRMNIVLDDVLFLVNKLTSRYELDEKYCQTQSQQAIKLRQP